MTAAAREAVRRLPVAESKIRTRSYSQQRLGRMKTFLQAVENESAHLREEIEKLQHLTNGKALALLSEESRLSISQDAEKKHSDYAETLRTLQQYTYRYTGDGTEVDWPKFWQDQAAACRLLIAALHETLQKMRRILGALQVRIERQ